MEDVLNEPVTPELTDPNPFAPLAGDTHDDDSEVYEADFVMAAHPPQTYDGVIPTTKTLAPTTRMLAAVVPVGQDSNGVQLDPVMLFPADPNRKQLEIRCYDSLGGIFPSVYPFVLASDKATCYTNAIVGAGGGDAAGYGFKSDCHTGAVWVYADLGANGGYVSGVAITT